MAITEVHTLSLDLPLFYKWDGVKRTRKNAWTHFIRFYHPTYKNCSRKTKKLFKTKSVRLYYYRKGRVYTINPLLLSTPTPNFSFMMNAKQIPATSGETMKFRRFKE